MQLSSNDFKRSGGLSAKLSELCGRQINIYLMEDCNDHIKAVSDDGTIFTISEFSGNFKDLYKELSKSVRYPIFGCYALLKIKDGKVINYDTGNPIIIEEHPSGSSFKKVLDRFSDSDKFDHTSKEKLFQPMALINQFRNNKPENYYPFVDRFSEEFMSLLTQLETESNILEISESRRCLGKWLPIIRNSELSLIHGNFLPENIYENRAFKKSSFDFGDVSLDVAGLIFGIIKSSFGSYGKIKEPYITAASLIIHSCTENDIKNINKKLIPYISYFSLKESIKSGRFFFNLGRNLLIEEEFDINEINFLMELDLEVEKHEAED